MEKLTQEERDAIRSDLSQMYAKIVHMPQHAGRVRSFADIDKHFAKIVRFVRSKGQKSLTWAQFVRIVTAKDLDAYMRQKSGRNKPKMPQYEPPRARFVSGGMPR